MQRRAGGYRLGLHDVLEVHVFGYDKMNTVARVGENGCINLPPLGEVKVSGLTERQLETHLQDRLRGKYLQDPHVTVLVKEPHSMEVAVVGEVTKPGRYSMLGERSVLDLLAESGGLTEKAGNVAYLLWLENASTSNPLGASLTSASLQNPSVNFGPEIRSIKIDLDGLLIRGEEQWNIPVKAGDLLNIPEAGWVHVTGRGVEKPGTYPLTRTAKTLRQVIDEAGGLKWEANKKMFILRKDENNRESAILVDYRKILKDSRNDVPMHAGDTVITDRTIPKGALAGTGRFVAQLVHVGIYGSVPLFAP